ncbi:MAG: hypothetical protein AAF385_04670 [Pseudomonadota bacterium]
MKLRIRGDSLRLRVTQAELNRIGEGEVVSESIRFAHDSVLCYQLSTSVEATKVVARFQGNTVDVYLPPSIAESWVETEQVGIKGEQDIGDGAMLSLLIEKDFACLQPRPGEDESDMFANPDAGDTC